MRQIKRGVRTEDEFVSTIQKIIKYIVRHRETSIWIGIGVIAAAVAITYFFSSSEQQDPKADLLNTQAIGLMSAGQFQDAENVLLDLTKKFQNTRPGKVGFYYLGVLYYHTGRFEESRNAFDKFLSLQKSDFLLVPSALIGAGNAAEGMKDYERALRYYERVIKDKNSQFYFQGMLAYGRINGIIGKIERAREVFNNIVEQNPPPDIAADAKFYLGYFNK